MEQAHFLSTSCFQLPTSKCTKIHNRSSIFFMIVEYYLMGIKVDTNYNFPRHRKASHHWGITNLVLLKVFPITKARLCVLVTYQYN